MPHPIAAANTFVLTLPSVWSRLPYAFPAAHHHDQRRKDDRDSGHVRLDFYRSVLSPTAFPSSYSVPPPPPNLFLTTPLSHDSIFTTLVLTTLVLTTLFLTTLILTTLFLTTLFLTTPSLSPAPRSWGEHLCDPDHVRLGLPSVPDRPPVVQASQPPLLVRGAPDGAEGEARSHTGPPGKHPAQAAHRRGSRLHRHGHALTYLCSRSEPPGKRAANRGTCKYKTLLTPPQAVALGCMFSYPRDPPRWRRTGS